MADHWAQQGAQLGAPPAWYHAAYHATLADLKLATLALVDALHTWPTMASHLRAGQWGKAPSAGRTARPPHAPARGRIEATHRWVTLPTGHAVCQTCATPKARKRLRRCWVPADAPAGVQHWGWDIHHTHRPKLQVRTLAHAHQGGYHAPLRYCSTCGQYGIAQLQGLAQPCPGPPTTHSPEGRVNLRRAGRLRQLKAGLHPDDPTWAPCDHHLQLAPKAGHGLTSATLLPNTVEARLVNRQWPSLPGTLLLQRGCVGDALGDAHAVSVVASPPQPSPPSGVGDCSDDDPELAWGL